MTAQHDYLWDPSAAPDAEIEGLERVLKPLSARALKLDELGISISQHLPQPRVWRRVVATAAIAANLLIVLYGMHVYRLSWKDGSPWPVTMASADGATQTTELRVGERVATSSVETATLQVARIGTVTVAPNSVAELVRTRKGQHRIELEHGRLHAKIWAPPNYFGVAHGDAGFTDLGCEFDLSVEAAGSGTLSVASGWVIYRHRNEEILVPENYSFVFDAMNAQIPVRSDASAEFRQWIAELDAQNRRDAAINRPEARALAQAIAAAARDGDYFTLLNLLVRYPQLADGPLYTRLAASLKVDVDEAHRARWVRGDVSARDEWWNRIPAQPKTWWLKWRDAF